MIMCIIFMFIIFVLRLEILNIHHIYVELQFSR
jgi:hypothetical protein